MIIVFIKTKAFKRLIKLQKVFFSEEGITRGQNKYCSTKISYQF